MKTSPSGFTVIELLLVMVIMLILGGLVWRSGAFKGRLSAEEKTERMIRQHLPHSPNDLRHAPRVRVDPQPEDEVPAAQP